MSRRRLDRVTLYSMNYVKALKRYHATNNRQHLYQAVCYGIKSFVREKETIPLNIHDRQFIFDDLTIKYENMSQLISFIQLFTPNELVKLFPIKKFYAGDRIGIKDYFYTMNVLQRHGLDTPIGREVYSILYDYTNIEISVFLVKLFSTVAQLDTMRY